MTSTVTWKYSRAGGVTANGPSSLINETNEVLLDTLRAVQLTDERFNSLLDEWWEQEFTLRVVRRLENNDVVYNVTVDEHSDTLGPIVVLAYILYEANQGNAELCAEVS